MCPKVDVGVKKLKFMVIKIEDGDKKVDIVKKQKFMAIGVKN